MHKSEQNNKMVVIFALKEVELRLGNCSVSEKCENVPTNAVGKWNET
jgi:hypothetical protein